MAACGTTTGMNPIWNSLAARTNAASSTSELEPVSTAIAREGRLCVTSRVSIHAPPLLCTIGVTTSRHCSRRPVALAGAPTAGRARTNSNVALRETVLMEHPGGDVLGVSVKWKRCSGGTSQRCAVFGAETP
jgi:hypothetical protein